MSPVSTWPNPAQLIVATCYLCEPAQPHARFTIAFWSWPCACTDQHLGEISAVMDLDAIEFEPHLHQLKFLRHIRNDVSRTLIRLQERTPHHQHPALAICFKVETCDKRVSEEERAHVVAVDPLGRRRVHLDCVSHAE